MKANDSSKQNEMEFTGEVLGVEFDNFFGLTGDEHDGEQPLENKMKYDLLTTHQNTVNDVGSFKGHSTVTFRFKCLDLSLYFCRRRKVSGFHLFTRRGQAVSSHY